MERKLYRNLLHRIKSALNDNYYKLQRKTKKCLPGGFPVSAMVELTNHCNLKCVLCPSGNRMMNRNTGFMDEAVFMKIVDELDDTYVRNFIPAMWGESLLHPKFIELMNYARKKTWRISLSTNGNKKADRKYFEEFVNCGIDEIVCAVDGHDQESYECYRRNGSLQTVHEFLKNLHSARKNAGVNHPYLIGQIHLFSSNEENLEDIKNNIRKYVDEVRTKKTRTFFTNKDDIKAIEKEREVLKPKAEELQFEGGRPSCPSMMHTVNINWEGEVIACCKDPDNVLKFGNVKDFRIRDIINSKNYVSAKKRLLAGDFWEDVCKECYKN